MYTTKQSYNCTTPGFCVFACVFCLFIFFTSKVASRKRDWLIFEREIDTLGAFVQVGKKWISAVFPNQIKVGKK